MASRLTCAVPIGWGGPGGSEIPPSAPHLVIWYQSAQVLSPTSPLPGGGLTGPPEVAGSPPPLAEAGLLLWRGVDDFPPWLGAVDFLPWLEVDGFPPWFEVDPCPLPSGFGWALFCHFAEAPVAGVSVWPGLGGRGQPLGWALGVLGISCPWRRGMR